MSDNAIVQPKEPNKKEIENILKQNILKIYNQIKNGCSKSICYNIYCRKNLIGKKSNYILFIIF
jgi:hypothetical protein